MAKEYIEREAALELLKDDERYGYLGSVDIQSIPTADVVEVVRCKDCAYWNKDALACDLLPWVDSSEHENWYAEDFCSYGERRTDDGNKENL